MNIQSPQDLLAHELQSIVDAETQASQALRAMGGEMRDPELGGLLERRLMQGEALLDGVKQCLKQMGGDGGGAPNQAARALIEQGRDLLGQVQGEELKRVVAIAAVQKLEHYCIAVWGEVRALAEEVGETELAELMSGALDEGKTLDSDLTDLAEGEINPEAIERAAGAPGEERSFGDSEERASPTS